MKNVGFYCTMIRGKKIAWLAGPFPDYDAAEVRVPEARNAAMDVDPWAAFDLFGVTCLSMESGELPKGRLNERLAI